MIQYSESRGFFRMMVNSQIELQLESEPTSAKIEAICRDLSATGMAVETSTPLEIGTRVLCRLEGAHSELAALRSLAHVVRCIPEGESNYVLGLEIVEHM